MPFLKLSNKLIHPSFQKDELTFTKAKTLLIILIFFLVVLVGYSSFFIFNGVFFNTKAFLNYVGLFSIASCLIMLKVSTNIKYPLRILSYVGLILLTGGVYWSGGFASNDILWYAVTAVTSLLFIGKRDGIIMTILSMCAVIGFYVIEVGHFINLPFDPLTRSIHYRFANAVIIILILFFLVWILVKRNHRLQNIIQNIQASQIRESISQDFHDELGNKLASVVHLSKRLKHSKSDEEKQDMLDVIENESQQVYDNFRDFIWTNDPNSVIISSLFMYLTDFNQQFFAHKEIQVEGQLLPTNITGEETIPSNIIRHIVPLFKELMTNIYKYSDAIHVDWSLTWSNSHLILDIKDDGIGFDTSKVQLGQGLKNINKRVIELQADYNITSGTDKGTHVSLSIDLTKKRYPNA